MSQKETLYTMKEIELATGIKTSTLHGRRKKLGISNSKSGYTLAEVKQMIKRPVRAHMASKRKAEAMKAMLKNDGAL